MEGPKGTLKMPGRRYDSTLLGLHNINLDAGFIMRNASIADTKQHGFYLDSQMRLIFCAVAATTSSQRRVNSSSNFDNTSDKSLDGSAAATSFLALSMNSFHILLASHSP